MDKRCEYRFLQRRHVSYQQMGEKILNISNANQRHNEIQLYTPEDGYHNTFEKAKDNMHL